MPCGFMPSRHEPRIKEVKKLVKIEIIGKVTIHMNCDCNKNDDVEADPQQTSLEVFKHPLKSSLATDYARRANSVDRGDKGGKHRSSCCNTLGVKATKKLGGHCKACYMTQESFKWQI